MALIDELKERRDAKRTSLEGIRIQIDAAEEAEEFVLDEIDDLDRAIAALEPAPQAEPETDPAIMARALDYSYGDGPLGEEYTRKHGTGFPPAPTPDTGEDGETGAAHPSIYIREEMTARGWGVFEVIQHGMGDNADHLALEMYLEVGAANVNLRIGGAMCQLLARAFKVNPDLFENLEVAWLAHQSREAQTEQASSQPVTADAAPVPGAGEESRDQSDDPTEFLLSDEEREERIAKPDAEFAPKAPEPVTNPDADFWARGLTDKPQPDRFNPFKIFRHEKEDA